MRRVFIGQQFWTGDGTETFTWHGYDLTGLMVGSEGTLGIISRVIVRLTRLPEANRVALALFPDVVAACEAVSAILAAGYVPTALEVMDATTMLAVNRAQGAALPAEAGAALIIEIDGVSEGLDETMAEISALCRDHGAFLLSTAATAAAQEQLWAARRSAFASFHTIAPSFYLVDTVVPRTRLPAMMAHVQRLSATHQMPIANVFHAGDGNLHPLVLYDPADPGQVAKARAITAEVLNLSVAEGGAVSGEHGIGIEKRDFLAHLYNRADLTAHAAVYAVFNPAQRLNPGKVFPPDLDPLALAAARAVDLAAAPIISSPAQLTRELAAIVGADHLLATTAFTIQGRQPTWVVAPESTAELAAVMAACYQAGVHVVPWGGGTQQAIGPLIADPDVVVVTQRLNRVVKYEPDDLTIGVEAGMTLADLKAILACHNQQFPLETAEENRATIGGLVATATDGPRRLGYGALRDLVLGLTIVQVDGTVITVGGQVVKNVSGYDLVKLFSGSHGTLGVISEVRLRVFPRPPAAVTLLARFPDLSALASFLTGLAATRLQPVALDVVERRENPREAITALARFEGHPAACARSATESATLAAAHGATVVEVVNGADQDQLWQPAIALAALPDHAVAWPVRLAVLPSRFPAALADLRRHASQADVTATIGGRPAQGLIYGHLQGEMAQIASVLTGMAERWPHIQIPAGSLPSEIESQRWGTPLPQLPALLNARIKRAFDPAGRLNPRLWPYTWSAESVSLHKDEAH